MSKIRDLARKLLLKARNSPDTKVSIPAKVLLHIAGSRPEDLGEGNRDERLRIASSKLDALIVSVSHSGSAGHLVVEALALADALITAVDGDE